MLTTATALTIFNACQQASGLQDLQPAAVRPAREIRVVSAAMAFKDAERLSVGGEIDLTV